MENIMKRVYFKSENTAWTEDSWFQTSGEKFATEEDANKFNEWWKNAHNFTEKTLPKFRVVKVVEEIEVIAA